MTMTKTTVTREELHTLLWNLTAERTGQEVRLLTPRTRLMQDLAADSLTVTELTLELEEKLGVTFPEELLDNPNVTLAEIEDALWKQCR